MSSKSKRKPKDVSMHKAVSIAMTIFVWHGWSASTRRRRT
nr:MAG TPA: hypothetical protein [Caudoviricetes sp.]